MGFLDDIQSAVNRGTDTAGRAGREAKLKLQKGELATRRRDVMSELGASLYDAVKGNPQLRFGREELFDKIAEIDAQAAEVDAQLAQIAKETRDAQAQAAAAATAKPAANRPSRPVCAQCGAVLTGKAAFCSACGAAVAPAGEPDSSAAAPGETVQ